MSRIVEIRMLDPYKNQSIFLRFLSIEDLEVTPYARIPSDYHVKKLISSIEKLGFLVPLMVVGHEGKGKYQIVDGQHRFLAASMMQIRRLPVIIVPVNLAERLINFNIEKELNIREKSFIALSIYKHYLSENANLAEDAGVVIDSIENAYYVTLGLGYEKKEELSGSAFESILSRCDFFLHDTIDRAHHVRGNRSQKVLLANTLAKEISEKLRERGRWHPYIYQQIVTWANPYKRRRVIVGFDEVFSPLLENLDKLRKDPAPFIGEEL